MACAEAVELVNEYGQVDVLLVKFEEYKAEIAAFKLVSRFYNVLYISCTGCCLLEAQGVGLFDSGRSSKYQKLSNRNDGKYYCDFFLSDVSF